jgi:hypothetical protein
LDPSEIYALIWLHLTHVRSVVDDLQEFTPLISVARIVRSLVCISGQPNMRSLAPRLFRALTERPAPSGHARLSLFENFLFEKQGDRVEEERRFEAAVNACRLGLIERGAAKAELVRLRDPTGTVSQVCDTTNARLVRL